MNMISGLSRGPLIMGMLVLVNVMVMKVEGYGAHNYGEALSKSILFFEGQRSGKLPPTQRMTWRKDSALHDGSDAGVDLVGGYYDAGDNVKFNFPMAFTTTMLAWGVLEFGKYMDADLKYALEAIKWGTDYFLKATSIPGVVFAQVGDPNSDHACWERPEDMDTPRTTYQVNETNPGSEVAGEIAAALAASSLVFLEIDANYSTLLLERAFTVFEFANTYQGFYSESLGAAVCPFYCDYNGYQDELIWAALWLFKATNDTYYSNYVTQNITLLTYFTEFGWAAKNAGIAVLSSKFMMNPTLNSSLFVPDADSFVCSVLPESPTRTIEYSPGGLMFKPGGSNLQHATALSFLLIVYGRYLHHTNSSVNCSGVVATPYRLIHVAQRQVDYILGSNPMHMSYMVGYAPKFPRKIHHRGSSLPCIAKHPRHITCDGGGLYFASNNSNPNLLTGAVVGGPDNINDTYADSRADYVESEPTTYINAPLVGALAYFKHLTSLVML
ncbi:hypothetical protein Vadar_015943 [Vaccinium darrowii]|uniref:Uncharacterized protein n=1 Tax=Vaccinium darrowii TaxID=229202 RepID=A0ACB7XIA0_9ERIC|nr:hypothetical protein Vadar_015943 [Vaccinium darrowii]